MWSSRRPCSLSSAISFLTRRCPASAGDPPMAKLVVLAFQQPMQRQDLRRAIRAGAIDVEPARDQFGAAGNAFQFSLEGRRFLAIGMTQSLVARREVENAPA